MPTWIWICLYIVGALAAWPMLWSLAEEAEAKHAEHEHGPFTDPTESAMVAMMVTVIAAFWPFALVVRILYVLFVARPKL